METIFIGHELIRLKTVDSTNNFAARMLEKDVLSDGTVIMAYSQTAGKGQMGNRWYSDAGSNLTCSVVLKRFRIAASEQYRLTIITSLALIELFEELGLKASIKWPNDILIGRKKIAGVLIENAISGQFIKHTIVGVGVNVNQTVFPDINATSLVLLGKTAGVNDVLKIFLVRLEQYYLNHLTRDWDYLKRRYFKHLYGYNESFKYTFEGEELTGKITDIDRNGRAEIESNGTKSIYDLKTISFVL